MNSMAGDLIVQLAAARQKLDRACILLLAPSPKALDECAILLEEAVAEVMACQRGIHSPIEAEPGASEEGFRLQAAVRRTRCLLESAAAYHRNWARRMGAMSSGYDGRGEPAAAAERAVRVVLKG